jgi:NADPH-dependent 2,4-dienoyl-CoA reductase/sulfur reductase-like enzyme
MDFVVIGGDAAGMSAASRAKRHNPDLNVIVLEKSRDVSYSACGMPYNIADPGRSIEDLIVRPAEVFRQKQGIDLRLEHVVEGIKRDEKKVFGTILGAERFEISFDKLLIATGASALKPDLPGFDLPGVMVLKSLAEGRAIKNFIRQSKVKKAVIIGMGYIALEMCEALVALDIKVDLVKPRERFLPKFAPELAATIQAELENEGVNLFPGHAVQRIERSGDRMITVADDLALMGDMILVATGVRPNSEIAARAGIQLSLNDAIAVDQTCQTSHADIYAAGDCADAVHVVTGQKTWIPLALRANRAGWAVADNVCGKPIHLDGIVGTAVFKVLDLEVARTGLAYEEAERAGFDPVEASITSRSRAHAHTGSLSIQVHMVGDRKNGRLLGVQMVGKEGVAHRINAAAVALHAKMGVRDFIQCDLAYAPPFGPVWDPLLTAANQLAKKIDP